MRMRPLVPWLVLAGVLTGCGGSSGADISHPTGHDDVVVRVDLGGGMGTRELFFSEIPRVVITGDGTAYLAMEETTMTGIVSPVVRFTVPHGDLGAILGRADHDHLLARPPDYSTAEHVSDGESTTVLVAADGQTRTHKAYALDETGRSETQDRARLADFVGYLTGWARRVRGTDVTRDWAPTLRVTATAQPATADLSGDVATWPAGSRVRLDRVDTCSVVHDRAAVHALTTRAARYYRQGGTTYSVAAAVLLPGDSCSG